VLPEDLDRGTEANGRELVIATMKIIAHAARERAAIGDPGQRPHRIEHGELCHRPTDRLAPAEKIASVIADDQK
jgi:hypothetical protein